MSKTGKIWAAGVVVVAIVSIGFAVYQSELKKQQRMVEARMQVDTAIWQFNNKDYEAALQTLRAIPEDIPEDWRALYYQGAALVQLQKYDEAVVVLEEAWRLNQTEEDIPFALAVAYFKLGNLQLAKGYFHAVLQLNPENADAKGLMDIMARLERMQPGATGEEGALVSEPESNDDALRPGSKSQTLTDE